jgi:hypothetical protein
MPTRRVRTLPDHAPQHGKHDCASARDRTFIVIRLCNGVKILQDHKAAAMSALASMPSLAKIWLT